jgi:hypothetical protein
MYSELQYLKVVYREINIHFNVDLSSAMSIKVHFVILHSVQITYYHTFFGVNKGTRIHI